MSSRRTLLALVCSLALAGCAPQPEAPIAVTASLRIEQIRLDNGLLVVLNPDASATSAFVHVRYYAGSKDDPAGRAGLAHLVEHLTFESPPRAGGPDRWASLERIGAVEVNGSTSFDATDFHETVPPPWVGYALWVEASRMAHPLVGIDDKALQGELATIKNELRTRAGLTPYRLAHELLTEILFGSAHPYGRTANATRGEIDKVSLAELSAFATTHYQPSNATVVVSGRFDSEEVRQLVTRYFGHIPSRPSPARDVLPAARLAQDESAIFAAPIATRVVAMGWLFPPPETDGYLEMRLASRVVKARLRQRLVTKWHLADELEVDVIRGHLGSMLVVAAKLHEGIEPESAIAEVERGMSEVATLGRTYEWEHFGETRLEMGTSVILKLESPANRVEGIQYDLEYAGAIRSPAEDVARVQRMQPWDVGGAVQQFVVDAKHAVVILLPDPTAPPTGVRR